MTQGSVGGISQWIEALQNDPKYAKLRGYVQGEALSTRIIVGLLLPLVGMLNLAFAAFVDGTRLSSAWLHSTPMYQAVLFLLIGVTVVSNRNSLGMWVLLALSQLALFISLNLPLSVLFCIQVLFALVLFTEVMLAELITPSDLKQPWSALGMTWCSMLLVVSIGLAAMVGFHPGAWMDDLITTQSQIERRQEEARSEILPGATWFLKNELRQELQTFSLIPIAQGDWWCKHLSITSPETCDYVLQVTLSDGVKLHFVHRMGESERTWTPCGVKPG